MGNWGQWGENDTRSTVSSSGTASSTRALFSNPPSIVFGEDSSSPPTKSRCHLAAVESHYPTDAILKEIDRAFKEIRGETGFEFGATRLEHGMVAIRNAIRRNIEELLNREKPEYICHWGNQNDLNEAQVENGEDAKNIKQAIQSGQTQALEFRVKILENLWLEYGERWSART